MWRVCLLTNNIAARSGVVGPHKTPVWHRILFYFRFVFVCTRVWIGAISELVIW